MRAWTIAVALTCLTVLPAHALADDISDCNSDNPATIIRGCGQIIDAGKASSDALAIAHFTRGNALLDQGDNDGAIADYTQSIKLKPDYPDSFYNRGLSYKAKQDYDSAIADFTAAIKLYPEFAKAYYSRATAYEAKGDLKTALTGYQDAARLAPGNAAVLKKIAAITQQLGE